jgi:hypothetical protein
MTDTAREYGGYSAGSYPTLSQTPPCELPSSVVDRAAGKGMAGWPATRVAPGVCFPWTERAKELPEITGDPAMVRRIWEDIDALGNMYIWQLLLSF